MPQRRPSATPLRPLPNGALPRSAQALEALDAHELVRLRALVRERDARIGELERTLMRIGAKERWRDARTPTVTRARTQARTRTHTHAHTRKLTRWGETPGETPVAMHEPLVGSRPDSVDAYALRAWTMEARVRLLHARALTRTGTRSRAHTRTHACAHAHTRTHSTCPRTLIRP